MMGIYETLYVALQVVLVLCAFGFGLAITVGLITIVLKWLDA